MEYRIIIDGKFPSLNQFIDANRSGKGRWNKGNSMKQSDQKVLTGYILTQLHKVHITKPVRLKYYYYEPNSKRDKDNISGYFHKIFQDALVHCGVLKNDDWKCIVGFSDDFYIDKKYPRIEVLIQEV